MPKINLILNKYLSNVHTIIVGISGGPDSMFLLHALLEYQKQQPITIIVAHVDHNIRKTSLRDLEFVSNFCQEHNLIFESTTLNETKHTEAHLRTKRYEFFTSLINKYHADMLLTAHHADDLLETILMRLTRGSNLKGYSGFPILSTNSQYPIFRPLISLTKEEIINYNNLHHIPYVIDETNTSLSYTRNRFRHNILPMLKKENPKVHQKFLEFSEELIAADSLINDLVNNYFRKNYHNQILNLSNINQEHPLIKQKIIEHYLSLLYPDNLYLITKKHLHLVMDLINKQTNSSLSLPNNITLIKEYQLLKTTNLSPTNEEFTMELTTKIILPNDHIIEIVKNSEDSSNYTIRLNSEELHLPLLVRSKKPSDKMAVKNLNGTKKVQDILINSKISKEERKKIPLLTDSCGTILWLPGIKKSKFDKSKQEKYDIIVKYYSISAQKEKIYEEK